MMEAAGETVLLAVDDGIATVTLQRPHRRNALNATAWARLLEIFGALRADASIRAAVLTGAGGNFSSGDDIVEYALLKDAPDAADAQAAYGRRIADVYAAVKACGFPVYAAVEGYCIGGACSLAMACDFRIGSPRARFGIPAVRLGIMYPPELCTRLAGIVGLSHARRWLMEGEQLDAAGAHACGFIDTVAEDPVQEARARAAKIGAAAPLAIAGMKRMFNAIHDGELDARRADLAEAFARCAASDDAREAATAFRDKRRPRFAGR